MPPAAYTVKWTDTAKGDLIGIIDYLAIDRLNAKRVLNKLREVCSTLSEMPMRGRVVPELKAQGIFVFSEVQSPPWRIIYRVTGDSVFILAIFDSRRSFEDLLLERFTR